MTIKFSSAKHTIVRSVKIYYQSKNNLSLRSPGSQQNPYRDCGDLMRTVTLAIPAIPAISIRILSRRSQWSAIRDSSDLKNYMRATLSNSDDLSDWEVWKTRSSCRFWNIFRTQNFSFSSSLSEVRFFFSSQSYDGDDNQIECLELQSVIRGSHLKYPAKILLFLDSMTVHAPRFTLSHPVIMRTTQSPRSLESPAQKSGGEYFENKIRKAVNENNSNSFCDQIEIDRNNSFLLAFIFKKEVILLLCFLCRLWIMSFKSRISWIPF